MSDLQTGTKEGVPGSPTDASSFRPSSSTVGILFETERTGLARLLCSVLCPHHAGKASVSAEAVRLRFGSRSVGLLSSRIDSVEVEVGVFFSGVRIRHSTGRARVSGLTRSDATGLAEAVDTARCDWWRRALGRKLALLHSVREQLAELANPSRYMTADALRDLPARARAVAGEFPARWPTALSDVPEIRVLRDVRAFLEKPDEARANANRHSSPRS